MSRRHRFSGHEAIRAAKVLWRDATGKAWPGTWKAGRGNHRTYPRGPVFLVNPGQGWHGIVHDLSHIAYEFLIGTRSRRGAVSAKKLADYKTASRRDHTDDHALIERRMVALVLEKGWLDGRLKAKPKPAKPKPSLRERRYARAKAALTRAEHRVKLAQAAVKRLAPRVAKYEKELAKKAEA